MCSAVASMATLEFNRAFQSATQQFRRQVNNCFTCTSQENYLVTAYEKAIKKGGGFDARVFSVPEQEVVNVLIWRQKYTIYNALQAAGRVCFSQQELQGRSDKEIRQMLESKGLDYDSLPSTFRLGACCIKTIIQNPDVDIKDGYYPKEKWILDTNVPVFSQNHEYIKSVLAAKEVTPCQCD
jgi:tRNA(His) 5'-end guanylyltransferase